MTGSVLRPLRVVNVITGLYTGGAEAMLVKVMSRVDRTRIDPWVISLTGSGAPAADLRRAGVEPIVLGMSTSRPDVAGFGRLVRALRDIEPHVVQTWMYKADLIGGAACRVAGRPPVVWGVRQSELHHRRSSTSTRAAARACARLSSALPARILCVSDEAAAAHRAMGYDGGRMVVVPNGFDTERFRPDPASRADVRAELGIAPDAPLVGLVARFDPQKDHATFLRAVAAVRRRHPSAHFVLCGQGVDATNPGLGAWGGLPNVHLLGLRTDLPRLTAALDVAVSSSAFGEGFSNAIGEALACGVPCAATTVGNSATLVGDAGACVRPGDPAALADAIDRLLALDPHERAVMGARGRRRIVEHYSLDEVAGRYASLWEDVARGTRAQRAA